MSAFARAIRDAHSDETAGFAEDVVTGLTARPKRLSPKYLYDAAGSALFEQITRLPEYYPTRCELAILAAHGREIAALIPDAAALIEFGAGSSRKIRLMLDHLPRIAAYLPVDISGAFLAAEAAALRRDHPGLAVAPIIADFTKAFAVPETYAGLPRAGFFPGSTLGNFEPAEARAFLRHAAAMLGRNAALILGVDLVKAPAVLQAAYNDAAGVTAAFNLNLLTRINRELDGNFDPAEFEHLAPYNPMRARIEMHLRSRRPQLVTVAGVPIRFRAGETIHTESSHKYTDWSLANLTEATGWERVGKWTDPHGYFAVLALRAV